MRPRKDTVGTGCCSGSGCAPWNRATETPLGISTASPPRCSTTTRRAAEDTAIRPVIFSKPGWSTEPNTCRARDRAVAYREQDERVDLIDISVDDQDVVKIHSMYVGFLLPLMCELQYW